MSGRRRSGGAAIARTEHRRNVADRPAARSDIEQRARDDADHAVQKTRAANVQPHNVAVALDLDRV